MFIFYFLIIKNISGLFVFPACWQKEQIAKDLLSGEEEEETQSSAEDLTPSVTSHDASDLFPNRPGYKCEWFASREGTERNYL